MANISHRTKKTVTHLTGKFGARFAGVLFGTKDKNKPQSTNKESKLTESKSASKVPALEQSNQLTNTLFQIYTLMKKTSDNNKLLREKQNNFKEENALEDEKRHKKLLKALEAAMATKGTITEKAARETPTGSILESLFSNVGGLSTLLNVAKFFFASPLGISLLLGAPLLTMLAKDEHPEETNKMIQGAMGGPTGESQAIMDVIANTSGVERRKQNILADRPTDKKSMLFWKDPELQNKYLEQIGFDEKTGLTKAEKEQGYTGIDENGMPVKEESNKATPVPAKPSEAPTATPATTSTSSEPTSPSAKLNAVQAESNDIKVNALVEPSKKTINNTIATSTSKSNEITPRTSVPNVRNTEETFQRMIYYSTRVV